MKTCGKRNDLIFPNIETFQQQLSTEEYISQLYIETFQQQLSMEEYISQLYIETFQQQLPMEEYISQLYIETFQQQLSMEEYISQLIELMLRLSMILYWILELFGQFGIFCFSIRFRNCSDSFGIFCFSFYWYDIPELVIPVWISLVIGLLHNKEAIDPQLSWLPS